MNRIGQLHIVLDVSMADPLLNCCRRLFHQQWRKELATVMQQISLTTEGTLRLSPMVLDLGEITLAQFCERLISTLAAKLQPMMVGAVSDVGISLVETMDWTADLNVTLAVERGVEAGAPLWQC